MSGAASRRSSFGKSLNELTAISPIPSRHKKPIEMSSSNKERPAEVYEPRELTLKYAKSVPNLAQPKPMMKHKRGNAKNPK
jgi:hypothetical protein